VRELSTAVRSLLRQPTFTLAVVTTLGLSLGLTTGFFGVISALLLRPLPGVSSEGLIVLHVDREGEDDPFAGFSRPTFLDFKERSRSLAGIEAFAGRSFALETGSEIEALDSGRDANVLVGGQLVSGGFFDLLGTRPLLGRLLSKEDDRVGAPPVAVITEALWRLRFDRAPATLGRSIRVNGRPFTVVGVAQEGFRGHFVGFPLDLYVPLSAAPVVASDIGLDDRTDQSLEIVARTQEGVSVPAAEAELRSLAAELARLHPEQLRGQSVEVQPFTGIDADLRGSVIGFMGILGIVGLLAILVATVNIGVLVLARSLARGRDRAVRVALGASRGDLLRPLFIETLILFGLGGALGLALIQPAASALHSFLPAFAVPLQVDVSLDWRTVVFTLVITGLSAVLFGLGPAARAATADPMAALKLGGRGLVRGSSARPTLVSAQVALSMVLLFGASLFLRELQSARIFDPGFRIDDVALMTVDVSLLGGGGQEPGAFFEAWLERARALPGLTGAALVSQPPLGLGGASTLIQVDGVEPPSSDGFRTGLAAVGPGYFGALEIPLLEGRDFRGSDTPGGEAAAILSRSTAERFFPRGDAVGRFLRRDGRSLRVVGIVQDTATDRSGRRDRLFVYLPFAQGGGPRGTLIARGTGPGLFQALRRIARELLPGLPILSATTLAQRAGASLFPQRLAAAVTGVCGTFALLLATIGLYALIAFFVEEKRHEIAVRAALGADRGRLSLLALKQGLVPAVKGLGAGALIGLGVGRLVTAFVPTVGGFDAVALSGSAGLLLLVCLLAAYPPARRAGEIAPVEALRGE